MQHFRSKKRVKRGLEIMEAVSFLKEMCPGKSTISAHFICRPKPGTPPLRNNIILPHPVQKNLKILCFAEGIHADEAKKSGADIVGSEDLFPLFQEGKIEVDCVLCTHLVYPKIIKIARYLGPKGWMPSVKKNTVTDDLKTSIQFLRNSIKYTCNHSGAVEAVVGYSTMDFHQIKENIQCVMMDLLRLSRETQGGPLDPKLFLQKLQISATGQASLPLTIKSLKI